MADNIDIAVLAQLSKQTLDEIRVLRREVGEIRTLALSTVDYVRRLDRRMSEMKDDVELMLKAELGGTLSHFETRIENAMFPRMTEIEQRLSRLDVQS